MADKFLFRFNGQAAYEVDTGRLKKLRVVFGMIDEKRTSMAWYLFSSDGDAKSKRELASRDLMPPEQFADRDTGGRDIPHTFTKHIGLDELAINPKGTPAYLTLEITETSRFIERRIDHLHTKAKEVVAFPFGLQPILPSRTAEFTTLRRPKGKIHGKVSLLAPIAPFDANRFIQGPQGKALHSVLGR